MRTFLPRDDVAYYLNHSVVKAVAILRSFSQNTPARGVTEIGEDLGITRSVTQKLVLTLRDVGLLEQETDSRKYRVSPRVMEIAGPFLRTSPLTREGTASVQALVRKTGMTCALGILDEADVLYLVSIEAQASVKANSLAGERSPLHCTASGKCLLAFTDQDTTERVLRSIQLKPFTQQTITDLDELTRELEGIRARGYAENNEERVVGLCGVAVPVLDDAGTAIAALSVGIPKASVTAQHYVRIVDFAKAAGEELSRALQTYHLLREKHT